MIRKSTIWCLMKTVTCSVSSIWIPWCQVSYFQIMAISWYRCQLRGRGWSAHRPSGDSMKTSSVLFTRGYLESAKSFLTPVETENLPLCGSLVPYMQCVRFLADYINGDTYYKIKYQSIISCVPTISFLYRSVKAREQMEDFIKECL